MAKIRKLAIDYAFFLRPNRRLFGVGVSVWSCCDNWFRPTNWNGSGFALRKWAGCIWVMDKNGNKPFMIFNESELLGDWEIVTPKKVRGERDEH